MTIADFILKNLSKMDVMYDGKTLNKKIINRYKLTPLEYSTSLDSNGHVKYKSTFVGLLINIKNNILISLPKNFVEYDKFIQNPIKYITLILKTIMIYLNNRNYTKNNKGKVFSDYPFEPFFKIYSYYSRFGIYKKNKVTYSKGLHGKLLWNKILKRSNQFINNNDLIFMPLYSRSKELSYNFVSYCMIYAINHTINLWKDIITLSLHNINFPLHIPLNFSLIVHRLKYMYTTTFNDSVKILVLNLIRFFIGLNNKNDYTFSVECHNYSAIWEIMVRNYLRDCFDGIKMYDINKLQINFIKDSNKGHNKFTKPVFYYNFKDFINNVHNGIHFQPDYYFKSKDNLYTCIFDAKYYVNINKTDYKQVLYEFLLSRINEGRHIFNVLFIPSYKYKCYTSAFFILDPRYNPLCRKIALYVCHLNSITVTNHFINEDD